MKKILTLILAGTLALTMAACGQAPDKGNSIGSDKTPNSKASGSISTPDSGSLPIAKTTAFFGKISGITGNEIEFNLAKVPEAEAPISVPEGGSMDAVAMVPATTAAAADGTGGGAATRIEVEYTGETKNFIIPAGIEIKDPSGTVKQLSDLKKGTLLSITAQEDGTVTEVLVLE